MSKATFKPVISKLREIIIKDIAGKMEKYGFDDTGRLIKNKPLSEYDSVIKNNLISLFKGKSIEGNKKEYIAYIQDSARTFLHILICFKTMEQREIMGNVIGRLLNDHIYDAVIPDFINVPPMAFSDLCEKFSSEISMMEEKDNHEEDREYYNFIYMLSALTKEMAREVPLLFKDYEHNLVQPDFEGLKEILFNINKIDEDEYEEDDFLGWIYQYWVDIKDDEIKTAKGEKDVSYANAIYYEILNNLEEEQTQFGEFYTPRWVVKYIVDNTLKPYFEDNKKIESIKLLDPACGAGNFLVYAFDVFYELYKIEHPDWPDNHIIGNILEKNIFGVDIQREPLQITAINLWLKAKRKAKDVRIKNLNLFNMNILKANSLYRWENDQEEVLQLSLFQTEIELTEKQYSAEDIGQYISAQAFIAKKEARLFFKSKFNVIVMNPPFVEQRDLKAEVNLFLKKEYPNSYNNLISAFIVRASELLGKDGVLGFISSNTYMNLDSFSKTRAIIIDKFHLKTIVNLGIGVFDGPAVEAAISIYKKSRIGKTLEAYNLERHEKSFECLDEYIKTNEIIKYTVDQTDFNKILGKPFLYDTNAKVRELLLRKNNIGSIAEVKQGMITGGNEKYLFYKWEVPEALIGTSFFPYVKGGGYSKYANDVIKYINWTNEGKEIKENARKKYGSVTRTIKNQEYFFREALTYSQISSKGKFSVRYMPANCIFDQKGCCIFLKRHDLYYMLGLLNSKLIDNVLNKLNPTNSKAIMDIERLPFVEPEEALVMRISELAKMAKKAKEDLLGFNYTSDFYHDVEIEYGLKKGGTNVHEAYFRYVEYYNELTTSLDNYQKEIDEIIYQIYGLNNNDINEIEVEYRNISENKNKPLEIKKAALNYLRYIVKKELISCNPRIYTDDEIEILIAKYIEDSFVMGYQIVDELEQIFEKKIIDVIKSGVKIGSTNYTLAGKGVSDTDEPLVQQKILAGKGSNKLIIFWHLSHFLLEFEEDKKYIMQNEIRRLSNEVYRPRLQTIKEKLQGSVSGAEKEELEKQEKLLSEAVKILEAWKVVN